MPEIKFMGEKLPEDGSNEKISDHGEFGIIGNYRPDMHVVITLGNGEKVKISPDQFVELVTRGSLELINPDYL